MSSPGQPAPRSTVLCGPWANPDDLSEEDRPLVSDTQWLGFLMAASEVLYALSGRQWCGQGCSATVLLRNQPPAPGTGAWPYYRTWGESASSYWWWSFSGWAWFPRYVGMPPQPMAVKLPHDQVVAVSSVVVNGDVFTSWRLLRSGWIERTDGGRWQEFTGDTVIAYTYGDAPPESGVRAVIELAVELAKDSIGEKCELPKRVTAITRQGVAIAVIDPMLFLKEGRTGLYGVDLFLAAVNPQSRRQSASVWSPDISRSIRQ